ncbi:hypothetical protein PTKIN_Ptkin01aG0356500 [Pterospermum kingtungense]
MDSTEQVREAKFLVDDGTMLVNGVIKNCCNHQGLDPFLNHMSEHGDLVVGFDIKWLINSSSYENIPCTPTPAAILIFCTQIGCKLLRIKTSFDPQSLPLQHYFFDNKEITFVGVHIKDEIEKLRVCCGLEIRNAVDLSELAADVLHQPRLRAFGVRRLASEVLPEPFKTRPSSLNRVDWRSANLTKDQLECATTKAYAAYKIGKMLLGV